MNLRHRKPLGTVAYMGGIMALPEPFTWSWSQMLQFNHEALESESSYVHIDRARYSLHPAARNELVARMKGDWLVMLDTDIEFDPDVVARLVGTSTRYDLDIVSGLYVYKSNPKLPIAYMYNAATGRHEVIGQWDRTADVFQVDSIGAGCLFLRRRALERLAANSAAGGPFEIIPPLGEDNSFFQRVRKAGIKAWCAWRIQVGHLRYKAEYPEFIDAPREAFINSYPVETFGREAAHEGAPQ